MLNTGPGPGIFQIPVSGTGKYNGPKAPCFPVSVSASSLSRVVTNYRSMKWARSTTAINFFWFYFSFIKLMSTNGVPQ